MQGMQAMEDTTDGVIEFEGDLQRQVTCRLMIAFAALGSLRGLPEDAELVYTAVEPLARNKAMFAVYRAMSLALGGATDAALELMNGRLEANPDDDLAKVGLGVAMLLANRP